MDPHKRNKLIESAIELCAERGIHSASTSQIARTAGVAAGTLFTYFATKEKLMQAVYLECKSELIAAMQKDLPTPRNHKDAGAGEADDRNDSGDPPGFADFLRHVWTRSLEWGLRRPTRHKFLCQFIQLPEAERAAPEIEALLEKEMRFFNQAMDRARDSGEMIPVNREYLSLVFGALFDATLDYLRRLKKKDRPPAVQESLAVLRRVVAVEPMGASADDRAR